MTKLVTVVFTLHIPGIDVKSRTVLTFEYHLFEMVILALINRKFRALNKDFFFQNSDRNRVCLY